MKLLCPKCQLAIPHSDINIGQAIFHCRGCNEVFRLHDHLTEEAQPVRLEKPYNSKVQSFRDHDSMGMIIPPKGLSGVTLFFLFFTIFWNSITWFFVYIGVTQNKIFVLLFMIPFLIIGIVTLVMFLFFWVGTFSFLIDRSQCEAVWSIFGREHRKIIPATNVTSVGEGVLFTQNDNPVYGVEIKHGDKKSLKFGSALSDDERRWCVAEIRSFLKVQGHRTSEW